MKKFISTLTSLALTATALGGTLVMNTSAATNGSVNASEITLLTGGKDTIEAKPGDKIPVDMYVTQSQGFYSINLKMVMKKDGKVAFGKDGRSDAAINEAWLKAKEPASALEDIHTKMTEVNASISDPSQKLAPLNKGDDGKEHWQYGSYGFTLSNNENADSMSGFVEPIGLDSGALTSAAGAGTAGTFSFFVADNFSLFYLCQDAATDGFCIDSYGAFKASGLTTAQYKKQKLAVTTWDNTEDWIYDYALNSFYITVPEDAEDGTYTLSVLEDKYYNPSSISWAKTALTNPDKTDNALKFKELTIKVGGGSTQTTSAPTQTTSAPKQTSSEQKQTTSKQQSSNTSTELPTDNKPAAAEGTIQFDLLPWDDMNDEAYEVGFDASKKMNTIIAKPGTELYLAMFASNDPGCEGQTVILDFSEVEFVEIDKSANSAYKGVTISVNDKYANTASALGDKYVSFVWVATAPKVAAEGEPIVSYTINVPDAEGVYTIGETTFKVDAGDGVIKERTMAIVPDTVKYVLYGLQIIASNDEPVDDKTTASQPKQTSSEQKNTTSKQQSGNTPTELPTDNKPAAATGTIQFDLLPWDDMNDEAYEVGFDASKKMNTIIAKPGTELYLAMFASNDPGCEGQTVILDFSEVEFVEIDKSANSAYKGVTISVNDKYANTASALGDKYVSFVWVATAPKVAAEGEPIVSYTINVPDAEGVYTIGETTFKVDAGDGVIKERTMAIVPDTVKYVLYGLQIIASNESQTTTSSKTTTKASQTTSEQSVAAGDAAWKIEEVKAAAGETGVKVPVKVKDASGTSGFVVNFTADAALKLEGIEWADGYKGEVVINKDQLYVVWSSDNGADQKLANETAILNLVFTAPKAAGEYPVAFGTINAVNTSGNALTVSKTDGAVIVEGSSEQNGDINWTIARVDATAGETGVKVPVSVKDAAGTSGFVVNFKADEALTLEGIEWADGYKGEVVINKDQLYVVWSNDNGADQKLDKETVILNLIFTAPDKAGEYPVSFGTISAVNTDGTDLVIGKKNGAVVVAAATTSEPIPAGDVNWKIETVDATAGQTGVKVPVSVKGDAGTSGFVVSFKADEALTLEGIEWADGYTGEAVINKDQLYVVWSSDNGADQKLDKETVILNLIFTAPDEAGKYPVVFGGIEAVNTDGQALTIAKVDGAVVVAAVTTTSASTTSTEAPKTSTEAPKTSTEAPKTSTEAPKTSTEAPKTSTEAPDTTTTASNTTTTEAPLPAGSVGWTIATVNATAGQNGVKVPVSVKGDAGTAGFVVNFTADAALKLEGIEWADGYKGEAVINKDQLYVTWSSDDGADQKFDKETVILNLVFTAPDEAGKYPVEFGNIEAVNTDGQALTIVKKDGAVVVAAATTTSAPKTTTSAPKTTTSAPKTTTSAPNTNTAIPNPGHVVYLIDKVQGAPGETVAVPVKVLYDEGAAGFNMQFKVPEGFAIVGMEWGDAYTNADGEAIWNAAEAIIQWNSNDGANQIAADKSTILTLMVSIPEDAVQDTEYPVEFVSVDVVDTNEADVPYTLVDGAIYVKAQQSTTTSAPSTTTSTTPKNTDDPSSSTVTTTTTSEGSGSATATTVTTPAGDFKVVTSYETSFQAPTRVNYWSHDTRTFAESGGLYNLAASVTVYKYYVNADGNLVKADGTVITDASGKAIAYSADAALPAEAAFETKTADVTAITRPEAANNSPINIWKNEIIAQFGENYTKDDEVAAKHANKYEVECYYYPTEQDDPDFGFDGNPVLFGTFKIFIGVKGDWNLNNHVEAVDAQQALVYYAETALALRDYSLNPDPELDGEDGLIFYLLNVKYRQTRDPESPFEDPQKIQAVDAQMILKYYGDTVLAQRDDITWEDEVGYDLLDNFYGDALA